MKYSLSAYAGLRDSEMKSNANLKYLSEVVMPERKAMQPLATATQLPKLSSASQQPRLLWLRTMIHHMVYIRYNRFYCIGSVYGRGLLAWRFGSQPIGH